LSCSESGYCIWPTRGYCAGSSGRMRLVPSASGFPGQFESACRAAAWAGCGTGACGSAGTCACTGVGFCGWEEAGACASVGAGACAEIFAPACSAACACAHAKRGASGMATAAIVMAQRLNLLIAISQPRNPAASAALGAKTPTALADYSPSESRGNLTDPHA
jgi:hypothetical protein